MIKDCSEINYLRFKDKNIEKEETIDTVNYLINI